MQMIGAVSIPAKFYISIHDELGILIVNGKQNEKYS
jgi:hypothetical protein